MDSFKISISEQQFRQLIIEMLFKLSVEQDSLKMLLFNEYANRKEITDPQSELDNLNSIYDELRASSKKHLKIELKNMFGGYSDIDGLIEKL